MTKFSNAIKNLIQHPLCPLLYFNVTKIVRPIITQRMQINAAHQVWPSTKIQLCLWHLKRAVAKWLADSSITKTNSYNAELAKKQ